MDESSKEVVVTSTSSAVAVDQTEFHTKLARSINRVLFKNTLPERNELFAPGRMAYVIDLEEEYAESDIPTTLIRSKADVPNAEVNYNNAHIFVFYASDILKFEYFCCFI